MRAKNGFMSNTISTQFPFYTFPPVFCRSFGEEESSTTTPSRTVFVTGLDPTISAPELRKTFEQYGDIVVSPGSIFHFQYWNRELTDRRV